MKLNKLITNTIAAALAINISGAAATIIPKTDSVIAATKNHTKYYYSTQTKKITRTIAMYQPKGLKKVIQKAYIKRTVKTNKKTKKKIYGKWSTSHWKKYTVAKISGYTVSRSSVGANKVTRKTKNQTIKITYKAIKKANKKNTKKVIKKSTKKTTFKKKKTSSIKVTFLRGSTKKISYRVTGIKSSTPLVVRSNKQSIYYYVSIDNVITNQGTLQRGEKHTEIVKKGQTLIVYLGTDTGVTVTVGGKKIPFTPINGTTRLIIHLGNNSASASSTTSKKSTN